MKKHLELLIRKSEKLEEYFIVSGLIIISLLVFMQVILRYVFHTGIFGSDEIARFIFIFITWIGASIGVKEGEHINISLFTDIFPKSKKYLDVFSSVVCIAVCLFLLISGLDMIEIIAEKGQLSSALKIPMAAAYAIIPFSAFLMGFKYVRQLAGEIKLITQKV